MVKQKSTGNARRGSFLMYLLDTNICIFLIKNRTLYLKKKIFNCKKEELFLASITISCLTPLCPSFGLLFWVRFLHDAMRTLA